MGKVKLIALLVIGIVLVGIAVAFGSRSAVQGEGQIDQSQAIAGAQAIKITDVEARRVVQVPAVAVQRDGDPRLIDSFGTWTLKDMGYSDLALPCTDRFEAISVEYLLPEDADRGEEKWYVLHLNLQIEFSEESKDGGECEIRAYANDAGCATLVFYSRTSNGALSIYHCSYPMSSLVVDVSRSEYLPAYGAFFNAVRPGKNVLTILLAPYRGIKVNRLRVLDSSGIECTSTSLPGADRQAALVQYLPKLSADDEARARDIVLGDPMVQELLAGKGFEIDFAYSRDIPQAPGNEAWVDVCLDKTYQIEYDWPWPPTPIRKAPDHFTAWVRQLTVVVSLEEGRVLGIMPERHPVFVSPDNLPPELRPPNYVPEPKPQIPELTEAEKAKARETTLSDPRIQALLEGKGFEVAPEGHLGVWHNSGLEKLGAALEIRLDKPYWIDYDWPQIEYDEEKYGHPYCIESAPLCCALWTDTLMISVNLEEAKVVAIVPLDAPGGG